MAVKKTITKLPENSIPVSELVMPTYRKLKNQRSSSYELLTRQELLESFRDNKSIIVKIGSETKYYSHTIQPIIFTLYKNGKLNKSRSQTLEGYNAYKQFLVDRLKAGHLFKVKDN